MKNLSIALLCIFLLGTFASCKTKQDKNGTNGKNGNSSTSNNGKTNGKNGNNTDPNTDPSKKGGQNGNNTNNPDGKNPIPASMKTDGMVSGSIYQVFISAFGDTKEQARRKGMAEGRKKALNLMRKDPVLKGKRLKSRSVKEIRQMIRANTRVVRIQQEPNGSWSIVLHVERRGLKNYLRSLP